MARLLIQNASSIVTCDPDDTVYKNSNLLIENGVILYIGPESQEADEIIDAAGYIVYPGLINTHHHLYQTFSRNLPQVQNMELFDWLKALYEIWKNLDRDVVYHSSMTGMGELMKNGCTTCFDHHYVFPQGQAGGLLDAQFSAARDLGIRMYASRGSMSLSQKDGGLRRADCGRDSAGLSTGRGDIPRPLSFFHEYGGTCPLLPVQRNGGFAAPIRHFSPRFGCTSAYTSV